MGRGRGRGGQGGSGAGSRRILPGFMHLRNVHNMAMHRRGEVGWDKGGTGAGQVKGEDGVGGGRMSE